MSKTTIRIEDNLGLSEDEILQRVKEIAKRRGNEEHYIPNLETIKINEMYVENGNKVYSVDFEIEYMSYL